MNSWFEDDWESLFRVAMVRSFIDFLLMKILLGRK